MRRLTQSSGANARLRLERLAYGLGEQIGSEIATATARGTYAEPCTELLHARRTACDSGTDLHVRDSIANADKHNDTV